MLFDKMLFDTMLFNWMLFNWMLVDGMLFQLIYLYSWMKCVFQVQTVLGRINSIHHA